VPAFDVCGGLLQQRVAVGVGEQRALAVIFDQLCLEKRCGAAARLQQLGVDVIGTTTLPEQGNNGRGLGQAGGDPDESWVGAGTCSVGAVRSSVGGATSCTAVADGAGPAGGGSPAELEAASSSSGRA
jgi:hypothetical protein